MITLGIDIGGSATKGALVDTATGQLISDRIRFETEVMAKPKQIINCIGKICKELKYEGPIGAGFPGIVKNSISLTAANMHKQWVNANVAEMIQARTGQEAYVLNDADAAGLAEMRFGAPEAWKYPVVMFLTVGTGIGSALFVKGQLMPNTELGHLKVRGKDAEHRASDAIRQNNHLSWKRWSEKFTEILKMYEFLLNPDLFILGGGISSRFDQYAKYLNIDTRIIPAKLENMAGIIGAAMAAQENLTK